MRMAACIGNRERALRAARLLVAGLSINVIDNIDMDRLIVCGRCEWSGMGMDMGRVAEAVRAEIKRRMEGIEEMDWDRGDEEVMREREKTREEGRRERDRDKRVVYMVERRNRWREAKKEVMGGNEGGQDKYSTIDEIRGQPRTRGLPARPRLPIRCAKGGNAVGEIRYIAQEEEGNKATTKRDNG